MPSANVPVSLNGPTRCPLLSKLNRPVTMMLSRKEGVCAFLCHLVASGKFYPAGDEIPEGVAVPGGAMRYMISDGGVVMFPTRTFPLFPNGTASLSHKPRLIRASLLGVGARQRARRSGLDRGERPNVPPWW